jgi:hypothetical protein
VYPVLAARGIPRHDIQSPQFLHQQGA